VDRIGIEYNWVTVFISLCKTKAFRSQRTARAEEWKYLSARLSKNYLFGLSRTGREKAQTQHCTGASAVRTPRTQRGNKALFYGLFSFVTSPALQPTQCGASVVSFVVKKIFPLKTVEPLFGMGELDEISCKIQRFI
jgi:hypothetical protein